MKWTAERIEELRTHLGTGLPYTRIAEIMGVSKNTIVGAVRDKIRMAPRAYIDPFTRRQRRHDGGHFCRDFIQPPRWTDHVLTEPYAQRKLRRKRETEQCAG